MTTVLRILTSLLVALAGAAGCGFTFHYDARPLPPPPRSQAEACYHDGRLEVSTGGTEYNTSEEVGAIAGLSVSVTRRHSHRGLVFYRGGERLSAQRAMEVLKDGALHRSYDEQLQRLRGRDRKRHALFWSGFVGMMAGTGVMLGSLSEAPKEDADIGRMTTFLVAGGVVMAAGTTLALVSRAYRNQTPTEVYGELFMEKPLVQRLVHAITDHNRRVASRCGYRGEVNVPVPAHWQRSTS